METKNQRAFKALCILWDLEAESLTSTRRSPDRRGRSEYQTWYANERGRPSDKPGGKTAKWTEIDDVLVIRVPSLIRGSTIPASVLVFHPNLLSPVNYPELLGHILLKLREEEAPK